MMTDKEVLEWQIWHLDNLKAANRWGALYYLPHGTETDKGKILNDRARAIIWHDRELIRAESPGQSRWCAR